MSKIQVTKLHSFSGHRDSVYTLQPADQPHLFFSGAGDGMIALWNLHDKADGELIARVPNSVYAIHHLPEQKILVVGQNFSGLHLIDYENKKEIASLQLTTSQIFDLKSFENDIVIATGDGMITVVDLKTLTIKKKIPASEKSARSIAINSATGEMAVGFSDHYFRVFDLSTYQEKLKIKGHTNSIFTVAYSPDKRFLISGGRDAKLNVWSAESNYEQVQHVAAHMYAINHIDFSPNGKYFATASMDKSIKIWDAETFSLLKVIDKGRHEGHGTSVNKLLWTSFNNQLVGASDDRTISAWDLLFL